MTPLRAWLLLFAVGASSAQIHPTPMAGRWFPSSPADLEKTLDRSFETAAKRLGRIPPRKQLLALIAPHAGLEYSGGVAAAAYRLSPAPRTVILLGFSHRVPLAGVMTPNADGFATPLGEVKVDRVAIDALGFPKQDERGLCDHSLENQLPFLKRAFPQARVAPLYVGSLDERQLAAAATKLAARVAQGDLLIASSDFTHYGEAYHYTPFAKDAKTPTRLREQAEEALEHVGSLDVVAFDRYLTRTGDTICGRDPIRLLMASLARLRDEVYMTPADLMTSGELTGDYSLSVTYAALAFYPASAFSVDATQRKKLIAHSRTALEAHLSGARMIPAPADRAADLEQRTGAFVTIRKQGDLRGCIGNLSPRSNLFDTIADRTFAAARSDPRFPALTRAEGPVSLEVSLLTPLKRLADWKKFRSGLGAVLMLGDHGGLLLPQVATEMGWSPEQFLEGLSHKAGLPAKAYRDPKAHLYVFGAQVFGE
ncbi:MAG: AmmeMemoRadiSam system protein B [Bryobacteraceae bacterium]